MFAITMFIILPPYKCFRNEGKTPDERREAGVGFVRVRTSLVKNLESLPKGISDRLMVMRLPLKGKTQLTLTSVYAPTMSYTQEQK